MQKVEIFYLCVWVSVCVQSKFELCSKRVSSPSESALIKASLSADLTDTHVFLN